MKRLRHPLTALVAVFSLTVPWIILWFTGINKDLSDPSQVVVSFTAVVGAAFILTWAAETAEKDVPRGFALAVLAIIAVAPEYAVDALYAWEAGQNPGSPASEEAANLAIANMTGANRILIGLGWSLIALFAIYRARKPTRGDKEIQRRDGVWTDAVKLDKRISLEIIFIGVATIFAFFIPLMGGIDAIDAIFLVSLYFTYVYFVLQGDEEHEPHLGVPGYLQNKRRNTRIAAMLAMFVFSAFVILISVKPFAKGLESLGPKLGVSSFFMIQWVAPLASESPEFIATAYLVNKARTTASFTTLVSSKLNQWTLLIGTLVIVYSISLGYYDVLSFNQKQAGEIWLTAAQSFFAVILLLNFEISIREAVALLGLFMLQFLPFFQNYQGLLAFSGVYIVLGLIILIARRHHLRPVFNSARSRVSNEEE